MRLVDTSAWIEWITASDLGRALGNEFPEPVEWLVPTMVQFELAKWMTREMGEDAADDVVAFSQTCVVAPLDTSIAIAAASLGAYHRLASADAIIYATASAYGADLLTCDRHFEGLPGVRLLPKTP
jgi:predicted nucleic acid-binding protein